MIKEYLNVGLQINSNMSTTEEIAAKLDLLFTKMDKLETNLTGQVAGVNKTLNKLSDKLVALEKEVNNSKDYIKTVRGRVNDHEIKFTNLSKEDDQKLNVIENSKSCAFLAAEYEKLKDIPKQLVQLKKENVQLKQANDDMKHGLEQEKANNNAFQQYHRQIHHVKLCGELCGVPAQPCEDKSTSASNSVTLEVIKRICIAGNITYDPGLIDVCHRLGKSEEYNVPILIRFRHKDARCDFFDQRKKLQGITSQDVDLSGFGENDQQSGARKRDDGNVQVDITPIYMQDHLTSTNKDLLKLSKTELENLCKYPGYVIDGEVRTKVSDGQKFLPIRCVSDVYRIKNRLSQSNG